MNSDMPSTMGVYRLKKPLGAGGMGVVYHAVDETLGREVAIKVLHPHLLKNEEHKERFRREARVHAQLMHPNVVTLLALYEEDGQMALVMEMVHGKDLKEYLRAESNYPIVDLLQIALKLLDGLDAAHQLGLIHRDLKPANVLISDAGAIKLMDFGLAKLSNGDDDLTQTGATVGSFRYMSPEQITNQPLDYRTDIYSFGILLYQMVTGRLPFDATAETGGEFAIMEQQVREEATPPHEVNAAVPLVLSDLIMKMLAKSPDERPQSCSDVKQALQDMIGHLSTQASAPSFSTLTEHATRYFEQAGEAQWGKVKQSSRRWWLALDTLRTMSKQTWMVLASAAAMLVLGSAVLVLIDYTETADQSLASPLVATSTQPVAVEQHETPSPVALPVPPEVTEVPIKEPEKKVEVAKPIPKSKPKPVVKIPSKSKAVAVHPKVAAQPKAKDILDRVRYKIRRNHHAIDTQAPHEFHGGHYRYFSKLPVIHKKSLFTSYKRAEVRVYFYEVQHVKGIVVEQATVHGALFEGSEIKVEVQDDHFSWHTVLKRSKHDISKPVRISEKDLPALVKSVRVRLKAASPLTLGPIRLLE